MVFGGDAAQGIRPWKTLLEEKKLKCGVRNEVAALFGKRNKLNAFLLTKNGHRGVRSSRSAVGEWGAL